MKVEVKGMFNEDQEDEVLDEVGRKELVMKLVGFVKKTEVKGMFEEESEEEVLDQVALIIAPILMITTGLIFQCH